jgi:hypothetical protein
MNKVLRWWPFLVLLIIAVLILLWYIDRTWVNTVWEDGFIYVPLIGRFLDGHLALGDLFVRFGEHLLFGQTVLYLFDAKFLALDTRLDPVIFLVSFSTIAAIVYAECSRIFSTVRLYVLGILFVPLGLLCFSLVAPPEMLMSTQFACGTTVALLIAWFLQRDFGALAINGPRPRWPFFGMLIFIPLYFLFFSGAYFPGLVIGVGAMYACRIIITRQWHMRHMMPVITVIVSCMLLYFWYVLMVPGLYSGQGSTLSHLGHFFTDISNTFLSYIAGIGSSVIDQHTIMDRLSAETVQTAFLVFGGAMTIIGIVALWLFFKTKMYRKTYLPIYCMFYTLGIITAVRFGRGTIGDWTLLTNEWYSFHLRFFAIGVVWILLYALMEYRQQIHINWANLVKLKSWSVAFVLGALVFIFVCQGYANVAQWHRGPYVHTWLVEKRNALLFTEFFDNPADVVLWSSAEFTQDRIILEKYQLSCFSPQALANIFASSPDGILRISGWYDDDWVSRKGYAALNTEADGDISFEGFSPNFISSNNIEVRLNDEIIFAGDIAGGDKVSFSGHLQKGLNTIAVTCEKEVVPASIEINPDQRLLALRILIQAQSIQRAP